MDFLLRNYSDDGFIWIDGMLDLISCVLWMSILRSTHWFIMRWNRFYCKILLFILKAGKTFLQSPITMIFPYICLPRIISLIPSTFILTFLILPPNFLSSTFRLNKDQVPWNFSIIKIPNIFDKFSFQYLKIYRC